MGIDRALLMIGACLLLAGCFAPGSGTVPRFASSRQDARIVTSVSTEFDRSDVPHGDPIHTYDAAVLFNVSQFDPQSGRASTSTSERLAEYSQFLRGSDFNRFQVAWGGVESGYYLIGRVSQDTSKSLALVCVANDGSLLPGVVPVQVRAGETVYFGHVVLTMKVWPAPDGGVSHPARIVGIRVEDRPVGIENHLRASGIDPARVRFDSRLSAGCRLTQVIQTFRFR